MLVKASCSDLEVCTYFSSVKEVVFLVQFVCLSAFKPICTKPTDLISMKPGGRVKAWVNEKDLSAGADA